MTQLWVWLLARLSERSTVAGLVTAGATITGAVVAPDKAEAIATVAGLLASVVAVVTKEAK